MNRCIGEEAFCLKLLMRAQRLVLALLQILCHVEQVLVDTLLWGFSWHGRLLLSRERGVWLKRIDQASVLEQPPAHHLRVLFEMAPFRREAIFFPAPEGEGGEKMLSLLFVLHTVAIGEIALFLVSRHRSISSLAQEAKAVIVRVERGVTAFLFLSREWTLFGAFGKVREEHIDGIASRVNRHIRWLFGWSRLTT